MYAILVVLLALCDVLYGHTITMCYDLKTRPGWLIIWQEHWHGDQSGPAPYGILFSSPSSPLDTSSWKLTPHTWRNNINRASLMREKPNLVCNACYDEGSYNDWFSYEFPVCIFGAKQMTVTMNGDPRIVITAPSESSCATRMALPDPKCPDTNGDNKCDVCNCVACSGTPYDSRCGNGKIDAGEQCDDSASNTENCFDCKCKAGWMSSSPVSVNCMVADPCKYYGYSGKDSNTLSCVNSGSSRIITCAAGYYVMGTSWSPAVTLAGDTKFTGCLDVDECMAYGYSGKVSNTLKCEQVGINQRKVTCADGYYVAGTKNEQSVTLTGIAAFTGCVVMDMCAVYGDSGKKEMVLSCANSAVNQRTVTCVPGAWVKGTTSPTSVLKGNAEFPGCFDIDECSVYGLSGKDASLVVGCVQGPGLNSRTVTCLPGYYIDGRENDVVAATFIGSAPFVGCALTNTCTHYGFSGKPENSISCVSGINKRTLTCAAGYYAIAPTNPTVTLIGNATFTGCVRINGCEVWGFSNKTNNTLRCEPGENKRTIYCKPGYSVVGQAEGKENVVLVADAAFTGCVETNECRLYSFSGKPNNTVGCEDKINSRLITCVAGYKVGSGHVILHSILLEASATFEGCFDINECDYYGFSNKTAHVSSCENLIDSRRIRCQAGYYAVKPDVPSIVLNGDAPFAGCTEINECEVYGFSGKEVGTDSCKDGINERVIHCMDGYAAQKPTVQSISLTGNAPFEGCMDLDECELYGYSDRPAFVASCVQGINQRTVTCQKGYKIVKTVPTDSDNSDSILLLSYSPFPGCEGWCGDGYLIPTEQCDDGNFYSTDGCSGCRIDPGFDCGTKRNIGHLCCESMDEETAATELGKQVECYDSWWVPITGDTLYLRDDETHLDHPIRLCGNLNIGSEDSTDLSQIAAIDRPRQLVITDEVTVAGTVNVQSSGSLFFKPTGVLHIVDTCLPEWDSNADQLNIVSGVVGVEELYWKFYEGSHLPRDVPTVKITTTKCASFNDAHLYMQANDIPDADSKFPLVTSRNSCIKTAQDTWLQHQLPRCSEAWSTYDNANSWINVEPIGLCPGQIAGIAVGAVGFAALAGAAAFAIFGGAGLTGAAESSYVAL